MAPHSDDVTIAFSKTTLAWQGAERRLLRRSDGSDLIEQVGVAIQ